MIRLLTTHPSLTLALLIFLMGVLLVASSRLPEVLPRGSRLEGWALRWMGTTQGVIVLVGLTWAVTLTYGSDRVVWRWLTAGVFLGAFWSARHALSDWVGGMALRAEGTLRVGVQIRIDGMRSRILRLGLRSADVESAEGGVLRIPYGTLSRQAIEVSPERTVARSHTFMVDLPKPAEPGELMQRMVAAALLSSWSSAQPAPTVRPVDRDEEGGRVEVTVYPLTAADAPKVEDAVRAAAAQAIPSIQK